MLGLKSAGRRADRHTPRRRPAATAALALSRRLAGATALALVLLAGAAVLAPGPGGVAAGASGTRAEGPVVGRPAAWPAASTRPLLGVVNRVRGQPAVLARLDPRTLRPLAGPRVRLPNRVASHAWSPDRSVLALGDADDDVVHLVDPAGMRRLGGVRIGIVARAPLSLAWLSPRRLAVVAGTSDDGSYLVLVDPAARRVLSRRRLAPAGLAAAAAGDRLVLLSSPLERIGPARLLVMDDRGALPSVELPGVQAGFQPPPDWDVPGAVGVGRTVALVADPDRGRAFVLAAGVPVTEVDLATLRVAAHGLRQPASLLARLAHWLVPPVEAKLSAGTYRAACWLGDGRLALWGHETRVLGAAPAERRPLGVKLVDTRDWTVRPLHALAGRDVVVLQRHGDLVYAEVDGGDAGFSVMVASLDGGEALSSSRAPMPYLVGDGPEASC